MKVGYKCHTCKKTIRTKHFTAEDGRILCYQCRTKEKAKPCNCKGFKSALGIKK